MMRELWVDLYYHRLKPDRQSGNTDFFWGVVDCWVIGVIGGSWDDRRQAS